MKTSPPDIEIDLEKEKEEMKSLSSCVNTLTREGFVTQFMIQPEGLKSLTTEKVYRPEDVRIVNFYRFEGESDPADNSILYAIETSEGEMGTINDAYGTYSDPMISSFIDQVEEIQKKPHEDESTKE